MALNLDRKAFIDILNEGLGQDRAVPAAAARRPVGLTPEMLKSISGYGDVARPARRAVP